MLSHHDLVPVSIPQLWSLSPSGCHSLGFCALMKSLSFLILALISAHSALASKAKFRKVYTGSNLPQLHRRDPQSSTDSQTKVGSSDDDKDSSFSLKYARLFIVLRIFLTCRRGKLCPRLDLSGRRACLGHLLSCKAKATYRLRLEELVRTQALALTVYTQSCVVDYAVQLDTGSSDLFIKGEKSPIPGSTSTVRALSSTVSY